MDYEEKYKQALERASKLRVQNPFDTVGQMVEHIFPDLAESEDERIRNGLIALLKFGLEDGSAIAPGFNVTKEQALAWLEKQDEQTNVVPQSEVTKTSDQELEQKFHPGDWIIDNEYGEVLKVTKADANSYEITTQDGEAFEFLKEDVECNHRLWTIEDAKRGDVLVDEDNNIGLYLDEKDDLDWHSYIYLGCDNCLRSVGGYHNNKDTKPATKEQRDLFFQKMADAGYEWDSKKKELKEKIESKTLNADKVIEWIDEHVPTKFEDMANYVQQFKKDFKL